MTQKVISRGICAIVALGLSLPAAAAPKKTAAKPADPMVYCPIMDMSVKKSKTHASKVNGKTYLVCCKKCKTMFDKNPKKSAAEYEKDVAAHNKSQKKG